MLARPQVVLVDHHDSFTHNLAHLIASVIGVLPTITMHDDPRIGDALATATHVVLSPGPGTPTSRHDFAAGHLLQQAVWPVLGVCLGMQGLAVAHGGAVEPVEPAHGRVARIAHHGDGLFAGLPQGFVAVRYHSLAVTAVPHELEVTASDQAGVVMGLRHRTLPLSGVQFHPESVLSEHGRTIIANFLAAT